MGIIPAKFGQNPTCSLGGGVIKSIVNGRRTDG